MLEVIPRFLIFSNPNHFAQDISKSGDLPLDRSFFDSGHLCGVATHLI